MRIPLQYQIMLPLAAVAAISLTAVGAINARIASRETASQINDQLQGVVRVLVTSNFPLTETVLHQMKDLSGADFVLVRASGRQLSTTDVDDTTELPDRNIVDDLMKLELGSQVSLEGEQYFHNAIHLRRRFGSFEEGVLHVLFPVSGYQAAWWSAFLPPLLVGVVAVLMVALVAHLLARRLSRTMGQIGSGVSKLAGGGFAAIDTPARDDELRDLVLAINQTANRLRQYEGEVRHTEQVRTLGILGAGIAHELRNAATGSRLAVDLHAENCPTSHDDESLQVAKNQLRLMESRLQRFMQLGQPNTGQLTQRVDLVDLVEEVLPLVGPAARHAGVKLEFDPGDSPLPIETQAESLTLAIVNLLLNAIEAAQVQQHAEQLAHVEVRLVQQGRSVELQVTDTGNGPPESLAAQLFEPFVTSKSEGVGLGLATVHQIVHEHGGSVTWNRAEGVTRFTMTLPLAEETPPAAVSYKWPSL